jgi:hypothetical protein
MSRIEDRAVEKTELSQHDFGPLAIPNIGAPLLQMRTKL